MKRIYAPWRNNYVTKELKEDKSCPFCVQSHEQHDEQNLILKRYDLFFVMMNKYPYNAGHLLLIPYQHVASIELLSVEAQRDCMATISHCCQLLKTVLGAQGINVGVNLGKAAGASIVDHLHVHIVPRWLGDTNFFPVTADVKCISADMSNMYRQLKDAF